MKVNNLSVLLGPSRTGINSWPGQRIIYHHTKTALVHWFTGFTIHGSDKTAKADTSRISASMPLK
jgi:tetrahydromethanopterin S-methyltransferase subunit B